MLLQNVRTFMLTRHRFVTEGHRLMWQKLVYCFRLRRHRTIYTKVTSSFMRVSDGLSKPTRRAESLSGTSITAPIFTSRYTVFLSVLAYKLNGNEIVERGTRKSLAAHPAGWCNRVNPLYPFSRFIISSDNASLSFVALQSIMLHNALGFRISLTKKN